MERMRMEFLFYLYYSLRWFWVGGEAKVGGGGWRWASGGLSIA